MKHPKLHSLLLIAVFVSFSFFSCATFPKDQLTLNLANEMPPVAYNAVAKPEHARTLSYEAGYKSTSVTMSSRFGNVTTTMTTTMSSNQNQPLGVQMQTLFINSPDWTAITSLVFSVDLTSVLGVVSTTSYMLNADTVVPVRK